MHCRQCGWWGILINLEALSFYILFGILFGIILNNMYICICRVTYKRMKLYATVS